MIEVSMIEELTLDQAFLDSALLPQVLSPRDDAKHGGFIFVPNYLLESLNLSLRDCDTQGKLEDKGVFAGVHKTLLLPQNYSIRAIVNRYAFDGSWCLLVMSPDLPVVPSGVELPQLNMIYQRLGDGTIRLYKIKIKDIWEKVYSPDVCPTCGRKLAGQSSKCSDGSPYETQFVGFADAIMTKLCDLRDGELVDVISDRWRKQAESVLAQCAYQFACHVVVSHVQSAHGDMSKIPDLPELLEEVDSAE